MRKRNVIHIVECMAGSSRNQAPTDASSLPPVCAGGEIAPDPRCPRSGARIIGGVPTCGDGCDHAVDNLTPVQRRRVEELKRERAKLTNRIDRIAFDNAPGIDSIEMVLRIIASLESP